MPEIKLPIFEGNPLNWQEFWQTFKNEIGKRKDITDTQKFHYLRGQLGKEPLGLIEGLNISNENFMEALTILRHNYTLKSGVDITNLKRRGNQLIP